jgi:hypothetical protein
MGDECEVDRREYCLKQQPDRGLLAEFRVMIAR